MKDPWAGAVRVMRALDVINDRELVRLDVATVPKNHRGRRIPCGRLKQYTITLGRYTGQKAIANAVTKLRKRARGRKPVHGLLRVFGPRDGFV